ncbi:MAG: hypothetical protein HC848_08120 [Limnobacter sp.]|nr:hypothetical protein [Limnobacter sp.]
MAEAPHSHQAADVAFESPQNLPTGAAMLRRYKLWALVFSGLAALLGVFALLSHYQTNQVVSQQIASIALTRSQLQTELARLNEQPPVIPEPKALQTILGLGREATQSTASEFWLGQLYQQKLQVLLTQIIEVLSRPISGLDAEQDNRARRERAIRLDALPRLDTLSQHIQTASNGLAMLLTLLASLFATIAATFGTLWMYKNHVNAYKNRIHTLQSAIQNQEQTELKRLGATAALEGVMNILEHTRNTDHRQALVEIGRQLDELRRSGHLVLEFANSFHQISSNATRLARGALTNEQRNQKADGYVDMMKTQLEGLREDMRNAAQGLRKAGGVSRQLLKKLQSQDQMELDPTDPAFNLNLQELVEQSQHALKEAIEGMVAIDKGGNRTLVALWQGKLWLRQTGANPQWDVLPSNLGPSQVIESIAPVGSEVPGNLADKLLAIVNDTTNSVRKLYQMTSGGVETILLTGVSGDVVPFGIERTDGSLVAIAVRDTAPRALWAWKTGNARFFRELDVDLTVTDTIVDGHIESGEVVAYCLAKSDSGRSELLAWSPFDPDIRNVIFRHPSDAP